MYLNFFILLYKLLILQLMAKLLPNMVFCKVLRNNKRIIKDERMYEIWIRIDERNNRKIIIFDGRIVSRITLLDYRFINAEEGHRYVRNVVNTLKNTIFGSNLAISCKINNLHWNLPLATLHKFLLYKLNTRKYWNQCIVV